MIDKENKKILLSNFNKSIQKKDFQKKPNCNGFGRIHHFNRYSENWCQNPLPMDPATTTLNRPKVDMLEAQVFQCSGCNIDCWYCFVPNSHRTPKNKQAYFLTSDELIDFFLSQENPPYVIDLSGGQPDLIPEWIPWMMEGLIKRNVENNFFLWSDDNLTTNYLFKFLSPEEMDLIQHYKNYAKVSCFKGISPPAYKYNSDLPYDAFELSFEIAKDLISLGIEIYFYVVFVVESLTQIEKDMDIFFNKLRSLHELVPLRTVPLKINVYGTTIENNKIREKAIENQYKVLSIWQEKLDKNYSSELLSLGIEEIRF